MLRFTYIILALPELLKQIVRGLFVHFTSIILNSFHYGRMDVMRLLIYCAVLFHALNTYPEESIRLTPIGDDFFLMENLPDEKFNIYYSFDLVRWELAYKVHYPEQFSIPVRGRRSTNIFWRVESAIDVPVRRRVLFVSAERGNDASAVPGDPSKAFATLQAAFKAIQDGDTVSISGGNYEVIPVLTQGKLNLHPPLELMHKKNVTLFNDGDAYIVGKGPGEYLRIHGCENIKIIGVNFRGNRPNVPENPLRLSAMVLLSGYNNHITIENTSFQGFGNHGISQLFDPRASRNVLIQNCVFRDGGDSNVALLLQDGAAISGIGSAWTVQNNSFVSCNRGIEVEGAYPNFPTDGVEIKNNHIHNSRNIGIMIFTTVSGSENYKNITISNNILTGDSPLFSNGIALDGGHDIQLVANSVRGYGIGLWVQGAKDIVRLQVRENEFLACSTGIYFSQTNDSALQIRIDGNTIHENIDYGILGFGGDSEIVGNSFSNNGKFYVHSGDVALFDGANKSVSSRIENNTFSPGGEDRKSQFNIIYVPELGIEIGENEYTGPAEDFAVHPSSWIDFLRARLDE